MSEADVSLIHDEDLLRRMWQQTEDFGRKKEIRAHMYKLREERLKLLYSPEPQRKAGSVVSSLADDGFSRDKRQEVRGAASPPRDRRSTPSELKPLSNAGWNVRSEISTEDGGTTRVRNMTADIQGAYDVEGGKGQFSARDDQRQAVTEYQDDNSSYRRSDQSEDSASSDHVVRRAADGATVSATTATAHHSTVKQVASSTTRVAHDDDSRRPTDTGYEQNLRRTEGELVSRRVEYPDSNTKVVVETRELPDGSMVTSTRRQFRDAVQSSRSEHQTRSSSTSLQSATTHSTRDIVQSQKLVDDLDFKANHAKYLTQNDSSQTQQNTNTIDSRESTKATRDTSEDVADYRKREEQSSRNKVNENQSNIDRRSQRQEIVTDETARRHDVNQRTVDETDRGHVAHQEDDITKESRRVTDSKVTKKIEKAVVKSTEQYQTTYQSDYSQKKVSSDLSPTHQAWASTLRGDSPDKSRRGSSPNKAERGSPTRSDQCSYSTHSVASSDRYISPDRKSLSPEKRPSASPDRKPYQSGLSAGLPRTSTPYRQSSPTKRSTPIAVSPTSPEHATQGYMRPTRASQSPTKHFHTDIKDHYKFIDEETKMYSHADRQDVRYTKNSSPDSDQPITSDDTDRSTSPSILRKTSRSPSPSKGSVSFTQNNINKHQSTTKYFTSTCDSSENTTREQTSLKKETFSNPREPSPTKYRAFEKQPSPPMDRASRDRRPADKSPRSSASPDKEPSYMKSTISSKLRDSTTESHFDSETTETEEISITKAEERHRESKTKDTTDKKFNTLTRREKTDGPNVSPVKTIDSPRDISPPTYGTYDKKQKRTEQVEQSQTVTMQHNTDVQYDSLAHRVNTDTTTKDSRQRDSPSKNIRSSTSPVKSTATDTKHTNIASDFIDNERAFEEINKKTRQLITPSSSPTRKPQNFETTPSTGQSSPTTSVSGFIYYGSPTADRKTIVTDLDNAEYFASQDKTEETSSSSKRPDSLGLKRSPSPSKIPCRSPSPPQKASPVKETLPRKSSLKKPPTMTNLPSPVEKPPTSFQVSPTSETQPEHKVVKKDRADKPREANVKAKPTLERRETYTERCLKILGVLNDSNSPVAKNELYLRSNSSPRIGAEPKQLAPLHHNITLTTTDHVTDFIRREQEDTRKKTVADRKSKTPSRDNSPTKLQDIISLKTDSSYKKTSESKQNIQSTNLGHTADRETGYRQTNYGSTKPVTSPSRSNQSPEKSPHTPVRANQSPERKPGYKQSESSEPTRSSVSPDRKPGFMKTTFSATTKINAVCEDVRKDTLSSTLKKDMEREIGYQRPNESSASPSPTSKLVQPSSLPVSSSPDRESDDKSSPRSSVSPDRKPGYMKSTIASKLYKATTDSVVEFTAAEHDNIKISKQPLSPKAEEPKCSRSPSPAKNRAKSNNDETKFIQPPQPIPLLAHHSSSDRGSADKFSPLSSVSQDREPGYLKSTISSKLHESATETDFESEAIEIAETRTSRQPSPSKAEEPKLSRTPSPAKITSKLTHDETEFIQSEREKEILDRVQTSLRKLSPSREQRSPTREKSPTKSNLSLQDIDVISMETVQTKNDKKLETKTHTENVTHITTETIKQKDEKARPKPISSPPSRNVSPTKKPTGSTPIYQSPYKARSTSPRKPIERPQSPHVSKQSGIKPRESTPSFIRKPSKIDASSSNVEKNHDDKKSSITKQSSFTKASTFKSVATKFMNKVEPEAKRVPAPKENKENVSPRKEETKVTRTTSDQTIKAKKVSPHKMKSKPEIQVNDTAPNKHSKAIPSKKLANKELHTKLAPKPKSATALNTSTDDDDIIIDMEQAKSSRENSPDRRSMCPTPVGFSEDVGTPRLPDEVKEPDEDFVRRTHNTIHETESLVDEIVEISEDEELQLTTSDRINQSDECLLSVTDKVSKFTNKIESSTKPKDSTTVFKDTERTVHSDFIDEKLKSDECLLTVSEKVNKFAKGPRTVKDKSPVRRITDEYDTETVYQDDFTKLSVNDKAHLFVETAENTKVTKTKPVQKVERPDFSNVEEALRSDDCLLSVSDKVNKFVKTAEQFLNETAPDSHDTEQLIKERYEKLMKQLQEEEFETKTSDVIEEINDRKRSKVPSFTKETASSHNKVKDYVSPHSKQMPTDTAPIGKITALRSSEAVKKAKALFENIATTQSTRDTNTTKLLDIGVIKKSPKTDSTIALHPSDEESPNLTDSELDSARVPSNICNGTSRPVNGRVEHKPRSPAAPEVPRTKSPVRRQTADTTKTKVVLSRYPAARNEHTLSAEKSQHVLKQSTDNKQSEPIKPQEKTSQKTVSSQMKEERVEKVEEIEVSTRRGSGKFGVELRRTSLEKGGERRASTDQRRPSADRPQPCVEDIYDVDLLEQMLEKVVGYEQRRRIRCQIRIAKKRTEEQSESHTYTKTKHTSITKSPERRTLTKSPERRTPKTVSPERAKASRMRATPELSKSLVNGDSKQPGHPVHRRQRTISPEKQKTGPDKRARLPSPSKVTPKTNTNRFSEYATAYMKKIGLDDDNSKKTKVQEKTENVKTVTDDKISHFEHNTIETKASKSSKMSSFSERKSSKETMEVQVNGKRSPSPDKRKTGQGRLYQRTPSPDFKRRPAETVTEVSQTQPKVHHQRETVIQTIRTSEETATGDMPSWVNSRNLKKVTSSETRTSSSSVSRHLVHSAPSSPRPARSGGAGSRGVEAITSGYGPGPLDADGRPLFGIRALRKNAHVRGTVVQSEMQCSSDGEPSGSVTVTAYSSSPEELTRLLQEPAKRPARLHGLAAITATARQHADRTPQAQAQAQGQRKPQSPSQSQPASSRATRQPVRQGSVKSLTEKYIKTTNESSTLDRRGSYPKAGLILRTTSRDESGPDDGGHTAVNRTDSDHSISSMEEQLGVTTRRGVATTTTTTTSGGRQERSFLDSTTKVTGVQDILSRMKNADIVIESGDTVEDSEARALLNKFLGATVLMAGMQNYITDSAPRGSARLQQESVTRGARSQPASGVGQVSKDIDLDHCWDEKLLKQRLEECTDYEQRRRIRTRLRALMAEQDAACAAVAEALGAQGETDGEERKEGSEETEVTVSARRGSTESSTTTTTTTTKTSKVVESMTRPAPKPVSPFAKFRQLEKQNSTSSQNSAPQSPGSPGAPLFKFTDPALHASALTIKERLLQWCRDKTRDYENVKLENFSTSWADGLAFCALLHHFLPDAFDYSELEPTKRRHNFTLAFKIADEKAGIYPLLDVDDMVAMRKPDWKCVFTYVQAIHRRFKDQP